MLLEFIIENIPSVNEMIRWAITAAMIVLGIYAPRFGLHLQILALAGICMLTEAISPHGWDNLTLQIVASGTAVWLFL